MKKTILLSIIIALFGCEKTSDPVGTNPVQDKVYLQGLMSAWYLWNDELPSIDIDDYSTQDEMLLALRNEQDKWSLIQSKADYDAYYGSGQVTSGDEGAHGIYMNYISEQDLYIRFSYPGSKAYEAGLRRGTRIKSINGLQVSDANSDQINSSLGKNLKGVENTFEITIPSITKYVDGEKVEVSAQRDTTITIAKEELIIQPVLLSEVIELPDGKKVGHLVFKSFIETAEEALANAFAEFKSEGVTELVLDLRYNGGGRVNIASQIAGYVLPSSASGKELFKYQHNPLQSAEYDESQNVELMPSNLNLERIFIFGEGGTASSSELVINSLKPYMDVQLLGQNTYGKPVGSYAFVNESNNAYVYSIISLRILNANGEGNYFDGLPVDQLVEDNVMYDWGDVNEPMLYQALYKIEHGTYDLPVIASARMNEVNLEHKNKAFKKAEPKEEIFNTIMMLKK
ncbi:S41 family peptidase [Flammeovirga sp. SJP92]|uniref:S41 family peptidase n=1 Tax=Flammeovirga sp. SJP92 TaxID=1775430 RepID=UPI00155F5FD8|nr:S41 family peptidase [Flammeovirga sp. SJP92]